MITTDKVPIYVRNIIARSYLTNEPYQLNIYSKCKVGGEVQFEREVRRLLSWCMRNYAEASIIKRSLWHDKYKTASQAYRHGHHNHYIVEITDPIMHRFEKDGFYRK